MPVLSEVRELNNPFKLPLEEAAFDIEYCRFRTLPLRYDYKIVNFSLIFARRIPENSSSPLDELARVCTASKDERSSPCRFSANPKLDQRYAATNRPSSGG
jgi:hypothetical protein